MTGSWATKVAAWAIAAVVVSPVALVVVLMVGYGLNHPRPDPDCAEVESWGSSYWPCPPGSMYRVDPSGVSLLLSFISGEPAPLPEWYPGG